MNPKQRDIIERIRKLRQVCVGRGATLSEEEGALLKMRELIHKHQLEFFDFEAKDYPEDIVDQECVFGRGKLSIWQGTLAQSLCVAFGCVGFTEEMNGHRMRKQLLHFVGHKSDVENVRYWFDVLQNSLYNLATAAWQEGGQDEPLALFRESFIIAASEKIGHRLKRQQADEELDVSTGERSQALVLVKDAAVQRYLDQNYPSFRRGDGPTQVCETAVEAGAATGNSMELNKGVRFQGCKSISHRGGR
jgi:hypothetical protein